MSNPSFSRKELMTIKNLATIRVNNCILIANGECMVCKKPHPNDNCSVSTAEQIVKKLESID